MPAARGLELAGQALEVYRGLDFAEEISEAAFVLGGIERALGLPEAQPHLEESGRRLLALAAELDDERRERYLASYGRRKRLLHSRRLE